MDPTVILYNQFDFLSRRSSSVSGVCFPFHQSQTRYSKYNPPRGFNHHTLRRNPARMRHKPRKKYAPKIPYFNAFARCACGKSITIVASTAALSTLSKLSMIIRSPMMGKYRSKLVVKSAHWSELIKVVEEDIEEHGLRRSIVNDLHHYQSTIFVT